jgi:hypothetical protein
MLAAVRRLLAITLCGWMLGAGSASAQQGEDAGAAPEPSAGAPAAQDDVTERAKARFKDGVAAFGEGRYEAALTAFVEANELKPHPSVLVNIANCHDKLEHPLEATQHYERFLEHGTPSPAQRTEIIAALKRLRAQLGTVVVRVRPEGAQVSIDGRQPTTLGNEPLRLAAGKHLFEATLAGHVPVQREIDLEGGGRMDVEMTLEPEAAPALALAPEAAPAQGQAPPPQEVAPAPEAASEPASRRGIPTAAWVTGGATVVVLAGALVTGVLALDANSEFDEQVARRHRMDISSTDRILAYNAARDAADRAQTLAVATDVLLGLGIVGAGVTVYLLLAGEDDGHAAHDVSLAGNGVRIAF